MKNSNTLLTIVFSTIVAASSLQAQEQPQVQEQTQVQEQATVQEQTQVQEQAPAKVDPVEKPKTYFHKSRSYASKIEIDPPNYTKPANVIAPEAMKELDWLDLGLDFRTRHEFRDNDLRRPQTGIDNSLLLRTRAYLGIHDVMDPLRLVVEFQDARRYLSDAARNDRDFNQYELIQGYGELHFNNAGGTDSNGNSRPLYIRGGRMAMEFLDRRLISRNPWRNTTNTFQGFRAGVGSQENDFQVDVLAVQPLKRIDSGFDKPAEQTWFWAAIGDIRRWSEYVTIQPYYLLLDQNATADNGNVSRRIHSPGIRLFGNIGSTGFDYDAGTIVQFGDSAGLDTRSLAATSELGYSLEDSWKTRMSMFYGYASGDKDPTDTKDQHFERFYGFSRPFSANDYITWENVHAPKVRVEFTPHKRVRFDSSYGLFWLASGTDKWQATGLVDPTGASGTFLGQEWEMRARLNLFPHFDATLGYTLFIPGEYPESLGRGKVSNFFYTEITVSAF